MFDQISKMRFSGELIYSDVATQDVQVLISQRYGLKGKPDALVRTASGDVIPVERKKSRAPNRPYAGDLIQATAYCMLVEETTDGLRPSCEFNTWMLALTSHTPPRARTGFFRPVSKSGKRGRWELRIVPIQHREGAARADSGRIAVKPYSEAITGRAELPDGFAYSLNTDALTVVELGEWIHLERQMLPVRPFLSFEFYSVDG